MGVNMTFSQEVKNEILKGSLTARHCQLARLSAFYTSMSFIEEGRLVFVCEEYLSAHIKGLLQKIYDMDDIKIIRDKSKTKIPVENKENDIIMSLKNEPGSLLPVSNLLIKNSCCKKAYLQGMFLCCGSLTNPDKGYHLEFVNSSEEVLLQISSILEDFQIVSRLTKRKGNYVLYIKEGQMIVDFLNVIGAYKSLLNMENSIIMKDFRNNINRKVNCETANILKSANAGSRQRADILYIKENYGLEKIPEGLREVAILRLEYPDISLKELGEMMDPPLGKSGVNHRLRKISELRDSL